MSLSDESAREKVGHCLRDMIAAHRPEEKKALMEAKKNKSTTSTTIEEVSSEGSLSIVDSNPWTETNQARKGKSPSNAQLASMWDAIKNNNDTNSSFPGLPDPPQTIRLEIDLMNLQKDSLDLMSEQQRNILRKLEAGFQGSVEELILAAAN
jgi:hypothetical protein